MGNNTGTARVEEFGDRLVETTVYPEFFRMLDAIMGSVSKVLMDELSRDLVAHAHDNW